jgi:hypothetical protein
MGDNPLAQLSRERPVAFDTENIDEAVLAVPYPTACMDHAVTRAWISVSWDVTDRLRAMGLIDDPG